ncbi:Kynureninase [Lentzea waywayandensis]|uniref:Kynureninase n=1 Tax=Lentzea waywayandensis TaxID=84724 RepID=A0A1I6EDB8_9PSEU|nr:aminotransferase class V-fold PLP-dependent enzyme [Lentzea waywayandensis]SFR15756.1 Kynureninase [Lentzea waywayandensis]
MREQFDIPEGVIYLDGNSLGAPPKHVAERVQEVVKHQWGNRLIRSWSEGWWEAPQRIGDRIGRLIGAAPGQVVVGDSTSVNVYKALMGAVKGTERTEIVCDESTFPTDGYIAQSVGELTGLKVRAARPSSLDLTEDTAVVLLNHVDYRTGALHDMKALTEQAHDVGTQVVWDLCHSAGVYPTQLDEIGVDYAVGCTYKFLNGGPGSPAFIYVPKHKQATFENPLSGWNGHRAPFAMEASYEPDPGIARARVGTPDILSMLALDAALDVWDGVDMKAHWARGMTLTSLFRSYIEQMTSLEVITPNTLPRGHQISVRCENPAGVMAELIARGVIGDHRPPDILRFGIAPLYIGEQEVKRAAEILAEIVN